MFKPYRKLAKLSLNLAKLSCINCKCIKFASRSAIESDNSAKAGSNDSRGASDAPIPLDLPDSLSDDREEGRRGVVGRDVGRRLLEPDLLVLLSRGVVDDDMILAVVHMLQSKLDDAMWELALWTRQNAWLPIAENKCVQHTKIMHLISI
jgi:hypothetical protein